MIRLRVKEVAEARKLSRRKLSALSGVDIRVVRKLWNQPFSTFNSETLDKLAKALEVDASELIESIPELPGFDGRSEK